MVDSIFDDGSHWLTPWEQAEVIEALVNSNAGLLKHDNQRKLPLKSGGFTDIYVNLRNARNDPDAIALLTELFANPLRRLKVDRFGEVPDSVSCFAGPLSIATRLPFVTIREEAKAGRVAKAKVIGDMPRGQDIVLIDDVITDGASKIAPARECLAAGMNLGPLVVLVDRQQGWRKTFREENLNLPVWSGMTLHHIRRYLIERGIMELCDPLLEVDNPFILALDGKSWDEILPTLDRLRTTGCILKVNDLMLWEGYRHLIPDLQTYARRIMVDLKGHDIPNTIKNITERFATNPPWAVTVHASGGVEMMAQAVAAFKNTRTKVLAVTVLTSLDKKTCEEIYRRTPFEQTCKSADMAKKAGVHGLVCSPEEVRRLRKLHPEMTTFVTPGIRSPGSDKGDQKRVATPAEAMAAGASHFVMGRQVFGAPDPAAEVHRVRKDELHQKV